MDEANSTRNSVEAANLTVKLGDNEALKDISFNLKQGDYMSVVGPNGAGKSTLVKVMLGLIKDYSGNVNILGAKAGDGAISKSIGYVPQIKTLDRSFPAQSIELVASGYTGEWVWKIDSELKDRSIAALKKVGVEHLAYRAINKLSGGELQRVYLARCFIRAPKLVILDEPATGVDTKAESDLCILVDNFKKEFGASIVTVTHDWNSAYHHSDYVLMINRTQYCYAAPDIAFRDDMLRELFGHIGHSHKMRFGAR